jgi:hypothetical protein
MDGTLWSTGGNIRAGIVELNISKNAGSVQGARQHFEVWRHSDEDVKRDDVERLAEMLNGLLDWGKRNKPPQ